MSVWIIPLVLLAPPRLKVDQFDLTIKKGMQYLQPSSRISSIALAGLLYLAYTSSSSPSRDSSIRVYLLVLCLLVPVGIYEIYVIFPINDAILALGKTIDEHQSGDQDNIFDKELHILVRKWQFRNWGRAGPSLVAALILAIARPPA